MKKCIIYTKNTCLVNYDCSLHLFKADKLIK